MKIQSIPTIVCSILLVAIFAAVIFNGPFRQDILGGMGEAKILGLFSVTGAVLVLLVALLLGSLLISVKWMRKHPQRPDRSVDEATPREDASARKEIEGKYYIEEIDNYTVLIRHLSENLYCTENFDEHWEGVGLLHDDTYFGIWRYKDNASRDLRGCWGVHKADVVRQNKKLSALEGHKIELTDAGKPGEWKNHKWVKMPENT